MKRIGIFSGTFDPFHVAHLEACLVAKAACELDTVVILVEKKPHRKVGVTAYAKRLAMIDLAIQEYPKIRMLEVPDSNITVENTLPLLAEQFGDAEYWYIVGSDMVKHLRDWKDVDILLEKLKLCVVLRDNKDQDQIEADLEQLVAEYPKLRYALLPEVYSPVSSSKIRDEIRERGYTEFVHREVLKYILTNNVY